VHQHLAQSHRPSRIPDEGQPRLAKGDLIGKDAHGLCSRTRRDHKSRSWHCWIGDAERDLKLLTYLETNAFEVWGPTQPHIEPPLSGRVLIMVMLARTGEARSIRLYELSDADTARWQSLGKSSTWFGELADSVVN